MPLVIVINRPNNNIQKLDQTMFAIRSLVAITGSLIHYTVIRYKAARGISASVVNLCK